MLGEKSPSYFFAFFGLKVQNYQFSLDFTSKEISAHAIGVDFLGMEQKRW